MRYRVHARTNRDKELSMDPDEARRRLAELMTTDEADEWHAVELLTEARELWRALDEWLAGGGFLPSEWAR